MPPLHPPPPPLPPPEPPAMGSGRPLWACATSRTLSPSGPPVPAPPLSAATASASGHLRDRGGVRDREKVHFSGFY